MKDHKPNPDEEVLPENEDDYYLSTTQTVHLFERASLVWDRHNSRPSEKQAPTLREEPNDYTYYHEFQHKDGYWVIQNINDFLRSLRDKKIKIQSVRVNPDNSNVVVVATRTIRIKGKPNYPRGR